MGDTTQGVHGQKDKEPSYKEQLVLARITGSDTLTRSADTSVKHRDITNPLFTFSVYI
jgi:hypothetical protein